ncbi:MAG: ATP-binding protein, partial [Christensenellales bacterium]
IGVLMLGILQPILIVLIAALVLSGMLAKRLSKRIVEPLNSLDLEHPLDNDSYEELSPLLNRINRQHNQITAQMRELKKRTDQFAQITASMNEGLVLLDNRGCILSINPAAIEIFGAEPSCVGRDFLSVDRSHDMSVAIQAALKDGHNEIHASRKGLIYQFDISRIAADGETAGVVILAFDITEKETAEQNRREFTANVSHELKTPLQGIIGSAELIENGMVKPEDMSRFVGHIRLEAQRLVTLIGDIIRLSQLDEGGDMPRENVDLLSVASAVADDLLPSADGQGISIAVEGSPANVYGVKRLLYEIVYNLCDNAIKYNRQGGSVKISTVNEGGFSSVTVSDTGIGIAPEYQNRIFERFFRVDKSHSKSSGGTGLGLSIVKHAVRTTTEEELTGPGKYPLLSFPPYSEPTRASVVPEAVFSTWYI